MKKAMKLVVVLFVVMGLAGIILPVYAEETAAVAAKDSSLVSGEVVSVDLVKSEITLKDNVIVAVAVDTKIQQDEVSLKLADLKVGDSVSVKYASDASGKQVVESIAVAVAQAAPVETVVTK